MNILALILNWLGSGVLTSVLGHLERRAALENDREKLRTEVTISEIKSELAVRQEQASILKMQLGHPIAWVPRSIVEFSTAIYFTSHIVDSIWNLSGDVAPLQTAEATLMGVVISGMFLTSALRR